MAMEVEMIIQKNMHDTNPHFSELVKRALAGDQVVIAKSGKSLVRLVPFHQMPLLSMDSTMKPYHVKGVW
jgi:prevent-host-death family protein